MYQKFILDRKKYDIPPNPTLQLAKDMVELARGYKEIESIGGGSVIDVGKYIAFTLRIPHTAVPTTAGTGSEVTRYAVFIDNGRKITLEDDRLIPQNYRLDPSNIVSLPPLQTAATGLDALCQGIESYWSPKANNESRMYSKKAIKLASKNLRESFKYPFSEVLRERMLTAAHYSGLAINITKTSVCHAISYPLTMHYGIPHGIACAHTLPFFIRHFGFDLVRPEVIDRLICDIDGHIKVDIDKELVATEALESERAQNCPREITMNVILRAL